MSAPLSIVVLGLSLSSSWGNGHATTYRALLKALARRGHRIDFLERDVPWYRDHRDLAKPGFSRLHFYKRPQDIAGRLKALVAGADLVIVGSYVPDGVRVAELVLEHASGLVAFYDIDTPVTLAKLERGDTEYLSPALIPRFDLYFSFTGGPTLRRLEREFGARRAVALYCGVDAERYRPTGEEPLWDLSYLGTWSADRQPALERFLIEPARRAPDLSFCVAGPQYPPDIDWPENVERIEHLGPADHPSFYSRSRFTLNVTRADMVAAGWSPSVRLFEAGACGAPILSDSWEGLSGIFEPGRAVLLPDGPDEVVRILRHMPEEERRSLGARARATVLAAHTAEARADTVEAEVRRALRPGKAVAAGVIARR